MIAYLQKYGLKVLNNGYEVVGIKPGTKHPTYDYSSETLPKITEKHLKGLLANGHANDGVGIRSRFTPMLDIDCMYQEMVNYVVRLSEDIIGYAPSRIGNAPKTGLIFRSTNPFKKVQSKAFTDPNGKKAQVEFLGDGQQFVALAIHPDTGKKYEWPEKGWNPIRMKHKELLIVTQEQALEVVQRFEKKCIEDGWRRWKSDKPGTHLTLVRTERDPDDLLGSEPCGISTDEVRGWVERLNNDESVEYEDDDFDARVPNYRNVIFAIWHETEGSDEGKEIALEWSEKSSKHEQEPGRFEKLWGSADPGDGEAITFRYVIKLVLTQEEDEKRELRDGYLESLKSCTDADDIKLLAAKIKQTRFDQLDIDRIAHAIKAAMNRITGVSLPIGTARKLIYHEPTEDDLPAWIKEWVYIRHFMRFHNRENGEQLEHKAFDAAYSRYLAGLSAVEFALHQAKIKTYSIPMYKPDDDEEFWFNGRDCINTFSERLMPEMPETYSKRDLNAIETVERHMANILPDRREREIFTSFLAYVVQTRSRPNWAVCLQGTDGDGKSFFFEMMGAVLGSDNVRMLDAAQLEDRYTAWAEGQLFTFIAELRMEGHNRFDILNKVKPFITDNAINIHPKNINPYTALNTTAYFATTNHQNALPLNDNDRRYFILYSAWRTGEQIRKFESENPGYFQQLFDSINRAGALRKWLMEYKLHSEFNPKGRAPWTQARDKMINLGKTDLQLCFEEIIKEDNHPQISSELVVSSALVKQVFEDTEEALNTRSVSAFLGQNGYDQLTHRIRVNQGSDNKESIWVKDRLSFPDKNQSIQRMWVRQFLRRRLKLISHRDDI